MLWLPPLLDSRLDDREERERERERFTSVDVRGEVWPSNARTQLWSLLPMESSRVVVTPSVYQSASFAAERRSATALRSLPCLSGEWPLFSGVGAEEVEKSAGESNGSSNGKSTECMGAVDQHEEKTSSGDEWWQWVKRHSKGALETGLLESQQNHTDVLEKELQEDAGDDQHGNDLRER